MPLHSGLTFPTVKAAAAAQMNSNRLRVPHTITLGDLFGHILQWQDLKIANHASAFPTHCSFRFLGCNSPGRFSFSHCHYCLSFLLTLLVGVQRSRQPHLISASAMLPFLPQVSESSHLALKLLCSLTHAADPSHSLIGHRILAGQLSEPAHTWFLLENKHQARAVQCSTWVSRDSCTLTL